MFADHSGVRYSKEDIKRRKVERKFDKRSTNTWGQVLKKGYKKKQSSGPQWGQVPMW